MSWRDVRRYRAPEVRGGALTHSGADWSGLRVLVLGLGLSGFAAADALLERGAQVRVSEAGHAGQVAERAQVLTVLGAQVELDESLTSVPEGIEVVVPSPGIAPRHPVLRDAETRGIPVWAEVDHPAECLWMTISKINKYTNKKF